MFLNDSLALVAVLCGAEGWTDIEEFGKRKLGLLRRFFDYKNGVPSDDTIRRFFRALNPDTFMKLFREWITKLVATVGSKVIAIDGKTSRRSFDKNQNALHTVSAFATEARIVLGQEKVADKSNEITAIPKLLEWLDISGRIITIDAMGCQYKIANQIIKQGGDYVFALKANQETLFEDVKLFFKSPGELKSHTDYDKGHGRIEIRAIQVANDVEWLRNMHPNWQTIKSIIKLDSTREIGDKKTEETRYYISSLDVSAEATLKTIRIHWEVENCLHWILDMSFGEDYSRIRKSNAPYIMTILRHMVCNVLQKAKQTDKDLARKSIKGLRKACGWDDELLTKILLSNDF